MARPQDGVENSAAFSRKDWPGSRPFWRNRRVMVTGGNGFLGRFMVGKLHDRGAAVFVSDIDRYQIEGRYPDLLPPPPSQDVARAELKLAGELFQWLKRQL